MKKVISISLFGENHEKYAANLQAFVLAHANLFPVSEGWHLRIHIDRHVANGARNEYLKKLVENEMIEVRQMGLAPLTKAMLWRMAPVFDDDIAYVFCRDLDCCPTPRDRAVCDEFIRSGCVVHAVHDSISHIGVMGGLCGFWTSEFRIETGLNSLEDLYIFAGNRPWERHGTDQDVLNELLVLIQNRINPNCSENSPYLFEHRFAGWGAGKPEVFPSRKPENYPCPSISSFVPDIGVSRLLPELNAEADRLSPHLGTAGFDVEKAKDFWIKYGDSKITEKVTV